MVTHCFQPGRQRAFTLNELMIAVAILAISIGLMLPSFQTMMANQRVRAAADALSTAVLYARSEAIKRHAVVEISRKDDDWNNGWSINVKGSTVVLRAEALSDIAISGLSSTSVISIGKSGRLTSTLTATVCDSYNRATARVVTISFSGQTRITQGGVCGS